MKIELTPKLPYCNSELVKGHVQILGEGVVENAYSLDKDFNIVQGKGEIKSNELYNYHNNYDDSRDTLWFNGNNGQWWTPSQSKIKELQEAEIKRAIGELERALETLKSKLE